MDDRIKIYLESQPLDRKGILAGLHEIILEEDKTVDALLSSMMGKEMIVYKSRGAMKYGLSGGKKHMCFHVLPMYASKPIFAKYQSVFNRAKFQKGCINFGKAEEMPCEEVRQLVNDCSKVDLLKIRDDYRKNKGSGRQAQN